MIKLELKHDVTTFEPVCLWRHVSTYIHAHLYVYMLHTPARDGDDDYGDCYGDETVPRVGPLTQAGCDFG